MCMENFTHDTQKEEYIEYENFQEVFWKPQFQVCVEEGDNEVDYDPQDGFLYKMDQLYVSKGEILQLIIMVHTSKVVVHFGVGKTVPN